MFPKKRLVVVAVSAFAIGALPLQFDLGTGTLVTVHAMAKNGGGSGNSGGNGGGHGGGNSHGKSDSGRSAGKSGKNSFSEKSLVGSLFGKEKAAAKKVAKTSTKTVKAPSKPRDKQQVASLAELPLVKEKNLHAKLGSLNSLQRNVNAYLNSKSPKFAAVQAFVMASAQHDLSLDVVDKANAAVAQAQEQLDALNAELDTLTVLTPEEIAAMTPEEQAALSDQIADLGAEVVTQEAVVATAEAAAAEAQVNADQAVVGTDDVALEAALLEMSNKTAVDGTLDPDVLDWAKDVLGVGDAVGKIDEVKETLEPEPII